MSMSFFVNKGVPQGSVIGPPLFNCYVASFNRKFESTRIFKYADDVNLVLPLKIKDEDKIAALVTAEIANLQNWCFENRLTLNAKKSRALFVTRSPVNVEKKVIIPIVQRLTIPEVTIHKNLDWKDHITETYAKANRQFYALRKIKKFLTMEETHKVYEATIRNTIEYACPVFVGLQTAQKKTLRRIFRRAHRIMSLDGEVQECNCGTFNERQYSFCIKLFLKAERGIAIISFTKRFQKG